jgi:hypothetical protein
MFTRNHCLRMKRGLTLRQFRASTRVRCIPRSGSKDPGNVPSVEWPWRPLPRPQSVAQSTFALCIRKSYAVNPGDCPICGMALEPKVLSAGDEQNPEPADMKRRFWASLVLTIPALVAAMGEMITGQPLQQLADQVAGYFVPIVVGASILTFMIWALVGPQRQMAHALIAAVSVLIIACPRALGLATPMSIMVAAGKGATMGVLFKNAEAIEFMRKVDTLPQRHVNAGQGGGATRRGW